MKITADCLKVAINELTLFLQENGLALDRNQSDCFRLEDRKKRVTWKSSGISTPLTDHSFATVAEYIALVNNRQFSVMLFDGSLLQISYTIRGNDEVVEHRLCWYPCPIFFQPQDLELATIDEFVLTTPNNKFNCRGPIRFDFSPHQTSKGHPSSHIHFFDDECRVPVRGPLDLRTFIIFVMDNFYSKVWNGIQSKINLSNWDASLTLTVDESAMPHIYWKTQTK